MGRSVPSYSLFTPIQPKLNEGIAVPRDFSDYTVSVDEEGMPSGARLIRKVG